MLRIKKTFTFTLPNKQAVPIDEADEANDLTLEIDEIDDIPVDEVVEVAEVDLQACQTVSEEPQVISDSSEAEEDSTDLVIDLDGGSQDAVVTAQKVKETINYKSPVLRCLVENCSFTTNVEKYLDFHLERHKLYNQREEFKTCKMCKQFKTNSNRDMVNHRKVCPAYERMKRPCTFPNCTYVAVKPRLLYQHLEKYHSKSGNPLRNPFDKTKKRLGGKRKNEDQKKQKGEKPAEQEGKKLKISDDEKKEARTESRKISTGDASEMDDTDEEALKIDETYEESSNNEEIKQEGKEDKQERQINEEIKQEEKEGEQERQRNEEIKREEKEDEDERRRNEEEAARTRNIEEQIKNTINLLCGITKNRKTTEDCSQELVDSLPVNLASADDIDRQAQENTLEDNNNLLSLIEIKELL